MAEYIDRKRVKAEGHDLLNGAQVNPKGFFALYLALVLLLDLAATLAAGNSDITTIFSKPLGLFVTILASLLSLILGVGCYLYCFGIRRGERMEFLTLFDGFSFVGKIILLYLVEYFFVVLWAMLLVVPGIIAAYRYRFAMLNLCENPSIGILDAINMSKRQTYGYKSQIFSLDLSYIGWALLANLPILYFNFAYQMDKFNYSLPGVNTAIWIQTLLGDLCMLAVGLFYLPNYEMAELGYFEIAKRSAGIGFGIQPPSGGPDQLGGPNGNDSF